MPRPNPPDSVTRFINEWKLSPPCGDALAWLIESLLDQSAPVSQSTLGDTTTQFSFPSEGFGDRSIERVPTEEYPASATTGPASRYEDLCLLGAGGMGVVRRVRDQDLNRTMAMKIIRSELAFRESSVARFVEEAQATAQLQHPGIVPVHELGRLPNGSYYFTMREVRGRTLREVIGEVHQASKNDLWEKSETGWTFHRLMEAYRRVCDTMAYAHARGVIHRDLKPDNIMLGSHGQVLVVDWGIAKVLGRPDLAAEEGEFDSVVTSRDERQATRMGAVAGTPAYMSPEQASGEIDLIDTASDVYSLGAILYEILSGRPPYQGDSGIEILRKVQMGPPSAPGRVVGWESTLSFGFDEDLEAVLDARSGPPLPAELVEICTRSMAREKAARFADAGELSVEIGAWLEGARRREQALEAVNRAEVLSAELAALRRDTAAAEKEARGLLADAQPWETEERKAPGWKKSAEAAELARQAELKDLEIQQCLYGALRIAPNSPEANAVLAERYRAEHRQAEGAREDHSVARTEALMRVHMASLSDDHEVRKRCAAYLKGDGALTLVTEPAGAEVELYRYVTRNRRLVTERFRTFGSTPLVKVSLPRGSYLCVIRGEGCSEVRYPVSIGREEHWDGVSPGGRVAHPVWLPPRGYLQDDECYIPAGNYWSGGDSEAVDGLPHRRIWSNAMVMKRFQVSNREYIRFLDDLVSQGREEDALRWVPRERSATQGEVGAMIYGRDAQGRFELRPDSDGDLWLPEWPVLMVDWWCAVEYGRWLASRTNRAWRLAGEFEWEKAARGADGRFFPWGDFADPSWCCIRDSFEGALQPSAVQDFPVDESPYGVRGLGGNAREWCAEVFTLEGSVLGGSRVSSPAMDLASRALRVVRGGGWGDSASMARSANRLRVVPGDRNSYVGFRVMCGVGQEG